MATTLYFNMATIMDLILALSFKPRQIKNMLFAAIPISSWWRNLVTSIKYQCESAILDLKMANTKNIYFQCSRNNGRYWCNMKWYPHVFKMHTYYWSSYNSRWHHLVFQYGHHLDVLSAKYYSNSKSDMNVLFVAFPPHFHDSGIS